MKINKMTAQLPEMKPSYHTENYVSGSDRTAEDQFEYKTEGIYTIILAVICTVQTATTALFLLRSRKLK